MTPENYNKQQNRKPKDIEFKVTLLCENHIVIMEGASINEKNLHNFLRLLGTAKILSPWGTKYDRLIGTSV